MATLVLILPANIQHAEAAPKEAGLNIGETVEVATATDESNACIDVDPNANNLPAGTIVTNAFPGVTITTNSPSHPPILFDSGNPTGGDVDLGAPHQDFGGPGIGSGGRAGTPGENSEPLGMLFILSESNPAIPDDNAGGGVMTFEFDSATTINSIDFVDIDESSQPQIVLYDDGNNVLHIAVGLTPGDNSYQQLPLDDGDATPGVSGVRKAVITMPGSGAIGLIQSCDDAPLSIGDKVWLDANHNGIQDFGEPGMSGVTVDLYDAAGAIVSSTTTDAQGEYYFTENNVPAGLTSYTQYQLKIDLAQGALGGTLPTLVNVDNGEFDADAVDSDAARVDGFAVIDFSTMEAGQDNFTYDFGFGDFAASISGEAWNDLDGSGIQNPEIPLADNVTVKLHKEAGDLVAETTTANGGTYVLDNLPPGDYTVEFIPGSSSLWFTLKDQGTDEALDSDVNVATGHTDVVSLGTSSVLNVDAGILRELPPYAPRFPNPGDQSNVIGSSVHLILRAIDDFHNTLTYMASNLPPGLSIDGSSGHVTGSPTATGVFPVVLSVHNTVGGSAQAEFDWTITSSAAINCSDNVQEAEDALLSGHFAKAVLNDGASGGQHILVPNGKGNVWNGAQEVHKAIFCIRVDTAGRYRIVGTVKGPNSNDDSFFVTVDRMPSLGYLWDVAPSESYTDDYVSHRDSSDPVEVMLSAGHHLVTFHLREDGTILDKVALELMESVPVGTSCGGLVQEAESGTLHGNFLRFANSGASGGLHVGVADGIGHNFSGPSVADRAEYCFDVSQSGTYMLIGKVSASSSSHNSFYVKVNDQPAAGYLWDTAVNSGFVDDAVSHRNGPDPVVLDLEAGQHTITIYLREDGTRLDKLSLVGATTVSAAAINGANASQLSQPATPAETYVGGVLSVAPSYGQEPALSGRQVTLAGDDTYVVTTDHVGRYIIDDVVPGNYTLTVDVTDEGSDELTILEDLVAIDEAGGVELAFEFTPLQNPNVIFLPFLR